MAKHSKALGFISLSSFDNAAGEIIAEQIGAVWLTISAATIGNEATMEIGQLATMEFGAAGATQSMTNTGTINVGYYDVVDSGEEATLAISGNFTVNGDGNINFGGNGASIVGDGLDRRHVHQWLGEFDSRAIYAARSATALRSPQPTILPSPTMETFMRRATA